MKKHHSKFFVCLGVLAATGSACNSNNSAQSTTASRAQAQTTAVSPLTAAASPSPTPSAKASTTAGVTFLPLYNSTNKLLPSDAGFVNVKSYGATGNGTSDDTPAIQAAINANIATPHRILFFPKGTYLVNKPLLWGIPTPAGPYVAAWKSRLTLQGQGQGESIIKLTDYNPDYEDPSNPTDVIHVASENISNESTTGLATGAGNDGFDNFIFDLTVDTGKGNPGAIGIDYIGNNFCGIRNVTIQSSDPHSVGVTGLSMERYATGPCIMKNITVSGFNYGVATSANDYGITFDGLTLHNQLVAGIYNKTDALSIENLHTLDGVPAIQNVASNGLITLINANLDYGNPDVSAIENLGTLYARNVATTGYLSAIQECRGYKMISDFDT